jgi:hypothetical protein
MYPTTHLVASVRPSSSCAFVSTFICTFTCTFFISNWLSLTWWVVVPPKPPTTPLASLLGRRLPMEQFCRGPQPVKGAYLVGTGSFQGGHLGRWSGAAEKRILTIRNFCGRPASTTGAPTTPQCLRTWIGGFQHQACLALLVWSSGPSGLWRPWFPLKGDPGRPLFLPWFFS